jgi:N-acyl-D-amino-acid deacylase
MSTDPASPRQSGARAIDSLRTGVIHTSDETLLLRGARVMDGVTAVGVADVRVANGLIKEVGDLSPLPGEQVRDLDGLHLAPGFIDTHTHADSVAFLGPESEALAAANLRQGVTTQVCGNCGFSPFPVLNLEREIASHLLPALGPGTRIFRSLKEWRGAATEAALPTNLAALVGHGTLRANVMGFEDRYATEAELRRMEELLTACLEDGALGFSSGLIYAPGTFAMTDELTRLARVARRYGALYATHVRNESDHVLGALQEAIAIGSQSGCPVHVSHHKTAGRANWGKTQETLARLERARVDGVDITIDVYPYTAGSTLSRPSSLPGSSGMAPRRCWNGSKMAGSGNVSGAIWWRRRRPGVNLVHAAGWEGIVVASASDHPEIEGKSLAELQADTHRDPVDLVCELLISQRANVTVILHMMAESDVQNVLRWPYAMIGSDGILQPGRPHPRIAGTFARVLATYVKTHQLLSLTEAVRRMTSLPARRFGLSTRGRIAPGASADLVVFDLSALSDRSTYEEPLTSPEGIVHVMVNGVFALEDGALTGRRAGELLGRVDRHGV